MRFQKLNDNKLKIFISSSELPNNGNFDSFITDTIKSKKSFLDILEKAYNEVGFNTQDYKIKIDAVALNNGDFIFTVTKLVKLTDNRKTVIPKMVAKKNNSSIAIYKFDTFEDFCNLCGFLQKFNITSYRSFAKKVELFLYNSNYYLAITRINTNFNGIEKFNSSIPEFCKFFSSKELFYSVLSEKGNLIIKNNAIDFCQKNII